METTFSRNELLQELTKSVHGHLNSYQPPVIRAATADPVFLAHLIAWDATNGQIKDTKVALPVLSLASAGFTQGRKDLSLNAVAQLQENSQAHLGLLPARELLRALRYARSLKMPGNRYGRITDVIKRYLRVMEADQGKWTRTAIRQRRALKALYAEGRIRHPGWVQEILFEGRYPRGSAFEAVAGLHLGTPQTIAGTIQKFHLSPLVVSGAMAGAKAKGGDVAVTQATMDQMSATELTTRAKSLERKGLSKDAGLKSTFRKKVAQASKAPAKGTLKTQLAVDAVEDEGLKDTLRELQERQIQAVKDSGKGINGDWLVIADKSLSMQRAMDLAKHVAAALAKFVTGKVYLWFTDTSVITYDVTGKSLAEITKLTQLLIPHGNTCLGAPIWLAAERKIPLDGVAYVSDGGENQAPFSIQALEQYERVMGKHLPVYLYLVEGDPNHLQRHMDMVKWKMDTFDLQHGRLDYYSIPNLVQTMKVSHFDLVDNIMACPLLTLDQVLPMATVRPADYAHVK